jgi:Holliday junction resolvase
MTIASRYNQEKQNCTSRFTVLHFSFFLIIEFKDKKQGALYLYNTHASKLILFADGQNYMFLKRN